MAPKRGENRAGESGSPQPRGGRPRGLPGQAPRPRSGQSPATTPLRNLSLEEETRDLGDHWQRLHNQVQDAFARAHNGEDEELDQTTRNHFDALQRVFDEDQESDSESSEGGPSSQDDSEPENAEEARSTQVQYAQDVQRFQVNMVTRFLDATGQPAIGSRPSARLAILFLARADYQFDIALGNFVEALHAGDEEIVADARAEDEREKEEREAARRPRPASEARVSTPLTQPGRPEEDSKAAKRDWSRLNPNVDREPAEVGRPNRKKLSIVLNQPGKKVSKTYSFTETFESMNWNNGQEIRRLNRWRSQIFLRTVGAKQDYRVPFHPTETAWLITRIRSIRDDYENAPASSRRLPFTQAAIDFDALTRDFNRQFVGQSLPNSPHPRPTRTSTGMRTELARIPEIVALTGMSAKETPKGSGTGGDGTRKPKKKEDSGDADDEQDEDGDRAGAGRGGRSRGAGPRGSRGARGSRGGQPRGNGRGRGGSADQGRGSATGSRPGQGK